MSALTVTPLIPPHATASRAVAPVDGRPDPDRVRTLTPPATEDPGEVLRARTTLATVVDLADRRRRREAAAVGARRHAPGFPPPGPLPDPTAVACAIVRTAIEVLRGERPVTQMARWVSPDILGAVHRRARLLAEHSPAPETLPPVTIVRTRTVRWGDHVAEATVVVRDRDRVRAAAVRLEAARGAWHAVAVEIG